MKNQPLVSIITVNYKQPQVTCELLDSISQVGYQHLEVIVVDNETNLDLTGLFKCHYPEVELIRNTENIGFAAANNMGIRRAKGDFIFLLNNDTTLPEGTIELLLDTLSEPSIAAVSPIIKYFDQPNLIQYAGFTEVNKFTGRNSLVRSVTDTEVNVSTAYFHGAAVMLSREAINATGLMPDGYFLYYEELAWSRAFTNKGYTIKVATNCHVLHKESVSTGKQSPLKTYYQTRNRLLFMKKYSSAAQWLVFISYFYAISLGHNLLQFIIQNKPKHLRAFLEGIGSFNHLSNSEIELNL